jgi:hypothetical protein
LRRSAPTIALAIVAVGGAFLTAAPALAAPTKVTWPVAINVRAAPATVNRIQITYGSVPGRLPGPPDEDESHFISDSAGITTVVTEPPSCYPKGPELVSCPDGAPRAGESFSIWLGDRNDLFTAELSPGEFAVNAGPGDDQVAGAAHPSTGGNRKNQSRITPRTCSTAVAGTTICSGGGGRTSSQADAATTF